MIFLVEANILTDVLVTEVSIVDRGANNKKILYKSLGDVDMSKMRKEELDEKEKEKEEALEGDGTEGANAIDPEPVTEVKEDEKKPDEEEEEEEEKPKEELTKSKRTSKSDTALRKAQEEKIALRKRLEEVEKALADERDRRILKEFTETAAVQYSRIGKAEAVGLVLKEASEKLSHETYEKLTEMLKAANTLIESGVAFKEIGKSGAAPGGSVIDQIRSIAKSMVASNPSMTMAQAEAKAWEMNPDLYVLYQKEIRG